MVCFPRHWLPPGGGERRAVQSVRPDGSHPVQHPLRSAGGRGQRGGVLPAARRPISSLPRPLPLSGGAEVPAGHCGIRHIRYHNGRSVFEVGLHGQAPLFGVDRVLHVFLATRLNMIKLVDYKVHR